MSIRHEGGNFLVYSTFLVNNFPFLSTIDKAIIFKILDNKKPQTRIEHVRLSLSLEWIILRLDSYFINPIRLLVGG